MTIDRNNLITPDAETGVLRSSVISQDHRLQSQGVRPQTQARQAGQSKVKGPQSSGHNVCSEVLAGKPLTWAQFQGAGKLS